MQIVQGVQVCTCAWGRVCVCVDVRCMAACARACTCMRPCAFTHNPHASVNEVCAYASVTPTPWQTPFLSHPPPPLIKSQSTAVIKIDQQLSWQGQGVRGMAMGWNLKGKLGDGKPGGGIGSVFNWRVRGCRHDADADDVLWVLCSIA